MHRYFLLFSDPERSGSAVIANKNCARVRFYSGQRLHKVQTVFRLYKYKTCRRLNKYNIIATPLCCASGGLFLGGGKIIVIIDIATDISEGIELSTHNTVSFVSYLLPYFVN